MSLRGVCVYVYNTCVCGDACVHGVCMCAWHVYVCVVMHVHMGMHVCMTHACVWSDACMYGACKYVWSMYVSGACMHVAMHVVCWCTCVHMYSSVKQADI